MKKRVINGVLNFLVLDGKVWVSIWSLVALIRFAIGKPVDPVFLGVLGIYCGHRIADIVSTNMNNREEK